MSTAQDYPKSPLPPQTQPKPGLDSEMTPRPQYEAPLYKGLGQARGQGRADHRRRLRHRPGGRRALRPRGGRRGHRLPAGRADRRRGDQGGRRGGGPELPAPARRRDATPQFCRDAVEQTVAEFGQLDILVNNAAYQETRRTARGHHRRAVRHDLPDEHLRLLLHGEGGAARTCRRAAAIINCGSITGLEGSKTLIDYAATKGAIHAFTKSLAQNLVERRHPRELRRPGADLDAAQPVVEAGREGRPSTAATRRWAGRASRRRWPRRSSSSRPRPTPATSPARC